MFRLGGGIQPHCDNVLTPPQFKITAIGPNQAPGTTAISQTARADIPDGGVAIKPANLGVKGINGNNRSVFLNMRFSVDWTTAAPANAPAGIPTQGPFFPVDNIGPASVRNSPGESNRCLQLPVDRRKILRGLHVHNNSAASFSNVCRVLFRQLRTGL
jgi:hypothetical protein